MCFLIGTDMPPTFLVKDFSWDRLDVPEHIEDEPTLLDYNSALWCLMGLNRVIKCVYPLAINVEGADDAYDLVVARLEHLRKNGDHVSEVSVVGPGNFNNFVRSIHI